MSETPFDQNVSVLRTLFGNSFGPEAVVSDGQAVMVSRETLPARIATKAHWQQLAAGFTEDLHLVFFIVLDIVPSQVDRDELMAAIYEANNTGVTYGAFTVRKDRDQVRFSVGLSGADEANLPAVVLADTLTYVLNMADAGRSFLRKKLALGKRAAPSKARPKRQTSRASRQRSTR